MKVTKRLKGKGTYILVTRNNLKQIMKLVENDSYLDIRNGSIVGWSKVWPNPMKFYSYTIIKNVYPYIEKESHESKQTK